MNKKLFWGTILTLACGLALIFITRSRTPFGKGNNSFASKPDDEITTVEFSRGKDRLSLNKKGNEWLLDDSKETRRSAVLFLLSILREMQIKSPVSPEMFSREITSEGIEPVKVKVYEERHLLKSFLVYRTGSNIYGNIMKMKGRSKPFIVYMPGFEGNIGSVFTLNKLYWQPYTVFNLLPSEIASVKFENVNDEDDSFTIINKGNYFTLADNKGKLTGWDTARVKRYLTYFVRIPFESWDFESGTADMNAVKDHQPLYRISVATVTGNNIVLTLWEKWKTKDGQRIPDSDRMLGRTENTNELFIIRYFDIDPLIKKKSYFYPE